MSFRFAKIKSLTVSTFFNEMNMFKDVVVCKFAGCNQVYNDARFLPCGNRTCASHVDKMIVKSEDNGKMIKCHFCQKIHAFPDDCGEFPVDRNIPLLLNMKHCDEHDSAKKSFYEVKQLLAKIINLNEEDYVIDYFEKVEANILLVKENQQQKIDAYFKELVDEVHKRKIECLHDLKTGKTLENELKEIKKECVAFESKLKKQNIEFILKTLEGDDSKWREMQSECQVLLKAAKSHEEKINQRMIGDQIDFRQFAPNTIRIENIPGPVYIGKIKSSILQGDYTMEKNLVELCKLNYKKFKLLYRASRDGFGAFDFHAKCDGQSNTLTIIKGFNRYYVQSRGFDGYIFGGYTAVAWDSSFTYKADPNAFIFSLTNTGQQPILIPIKKMHSQEAIFCRSDSGPIFGNNDIAVLDNSNSNNVSISDLGRSYDFTLFSQGTKEATSFLAGYCNFQTFEIEVFQIS